MLFLLTWQWWGRRGACRDGSGCGLGLRWGRRGSGRGSFGLCCGWSFSGRRGSSSGTRGVDSTKLGSCSYLLTIWNKQLLNHSRYRRGNRDGSLGGREEGWGKEREREREWASEHKAYKFCMCIIPTNLWVCICKYDHKKLIIMMVCVVVMDMLRSEFNCSPLTYMLHTNPQLVKSYHISNMVPGEGREAVRYTHTSDHLSAINNSCILITSYTCTCTKFIRPVLNKSHGHNIICIYFTHGHTICTLDINTQQFCFISNNSRNQNTTTMLNI